LVKESSSNFSLGMAIMLTWKRRSWRRGSHL